MFTQSLRRMTATFDALLTPHGLERYVELVAPTYASHDVRAKVIAVTHPTERSVTMTLRPNRNWTGFQPGQYTQLSVAINGVRHTRCYSMANSADATSGTIELTVTAQPGGTMSPWLVDNVACGDVVDLTPAAGTFTLDDHNADASRLLFISGGSGITPVMAMLRTLCDRGDTRPITFVHYAPSETDMLYRDELAQIAASQSHVRVVRVFPETPGTGDFDGFFDAGQLASIEPNWREAQAYVCGPDPLMYAVRTCYSEAGLEGALHTEAFTLPQLLAEADTIAGTLRFTASGLEVANDGRPILLQAEDAGLNPKSGCRMGICHTCPRRLTAGSVRDVTNGAITCDPDTDVRICVSVPVGDADIDL